MLEADRGLHLADAQGAHDREPGEADEDVLEVRVTAREVVLRLELDGAEDQALHEQASHADLDVVLEVADDGVDGPVLAERGEVQVEPSAELRLELLVGGLEPHALLVVDPEVARLRAGQRLELVDLLVLRGDLVAERPHLLVVLPELLLHLLQALRVVLRESGCGEDENRGEDRRGMDHCSE